MMNLESSIMEQRFYNGKQDEFAPDYGGVDWRAVRLAQLATKGAVEELPIRFQTADGLDQQCTQENTEIFVSQTSDDMDVIFVLDPRDDMKYSYFRSTIGHENFDEISHALQAVGGCAVVFTLYPRPDIVELWENQNQADLSRADTFPKEWEQGNGTTQS